MASTVIFSDRARDKKSNEIVALKKIRMENEKDGMPVSGLREIMILQECDHENIVSLKEVVAGRACRGWSHLCIDKFVLHLTWV